MCDSVPFAYSSTILMYWDFAWSYKMSSFLFLKILEIVSNASLTFCELNLKNFQETFERSLSICPNMEGNGVALIWILLASTISFFLGLGASILKFSVLKWTSIKVSKYFSGASAMQSSIQPLHLSW